MFGGQTPKNGQGAQKIATKTFNVCHAGAKAVWTSCRCFFWMKFMWKVYNMLRCVITS